MFPPDIGLLAPWWHTVALRRQTKMWFKDPLLQKRVDLFVCLFVFVLIKIHVIED